MGDALTTCVTPQLRSASRLRAAPIEPAAQHRLSVCWLLSMK